MKTIWSAKKLGIVVLAIFILFVVIERIFEFPKLSNQFNLLALLLTLVVLLLYAYDTHRIAEQTIETNLRPVVLRRGWITSWVDIKFVIEDKILKSGEPIQFSILKNIAKDITGYIVLNKKKYQLLFANEISSKVIDKDSRLYQYEPVWGWQGVDTLLNSIFDESKYEKTNSENCIYILYKDIEGNEYFTKEDKFFSQTSGKL